MNQRNTQGLNVVDCVKRIRSGDDTQWANMTVIVDSWLITLRDRRGLINLDISDARQQCLIHIYKQIEDLDIDRDGGQIVLYLRRLVSNTFSKYLLTASNGGLMSSRGNARNRPVVHVDESFWETPSDRYSVDKAESVEQMLATLEIPHPEILGNYFRGLGSTRQAKILPLSRNVIKFRLATGLRHLKKHLSPQMQDYLHFQQMYHMQEAI